MNAITEIIGTGTFQTGDVVWGRPLVNGKRLARRKGIVMGKFANSSSQLVVWWYGVGNASADAVGASVTMMLASELKKTGDIWSEFGARRAARLAKGCADYGRAYPLSYALSRHAERMRAAGVK